jgi:hypothetical protein
VIFHKNPVVGYLIYNISYFVIMSAAGCLVFWSLYKIKSSLKDLPTASNNYLQPNDKLIFWTVFFFSAATIIMILYLPVVLIIDAVGNPAKLRALLDYFVVVELLVGFATFLCVLYLCWRLGSKKN